MSIKAVLFDLDGTLLPMDQDVFVKAYFSGLVKKLAVVGYEPEKLIKAIWFCSSEMVKNDGRRTNEEVFWDNISKIYGRDVRLDSPIFDEYYRDGFDEVKRVCSYNEKADKVVKWVKAHGLRAVLATNPLFPSIATEKRAGWAGLDLRDFELYTTFENSRFSKPNLKYYEDILKTLGVKPEEALMVGNDVTEDMVVKSIGMSAFLLTNNLINKKNKDISEFPNGNFDDLMVFLDSILQ